MLEMDWVERHEFYSKMVMTKPQRFLTKLERCLSPQDLLKGKRTGTTAPGCLVMLDKTCKRQMKIEDFFVAKRPRWGRRLASYREIRANSFAKTSDLHVVKRLAALVVQRFAALVVQRLAALAVQRLAALVVSRFTALVVQRLAALVVQRFAALAVQRFAALVVQRLAALVVQRLAALVMQRLAAIVVQRLAALAVQRFAARVC
jgi:hypothetical protein